MYTKVSVTKPGGISPGAAAAKDPNVTIIDVEDILVFPARDSKGIVHVGDFVMKSGKFPVQIYLTKSKISAPYTSEGDEDSASIKQAFEGQHPGNKKEIREFIQNWMGKNVIIIHGSCSETEKEVVGTPCAPLQLKPEKQDNNDGRHHTLKFEAFAKSAYLPGMYEGTIPLNAPATVNDVTNIVIDTALNSQYLLNNTDPNAQLSFDSISANDRDHITFISNGGDNFANIDSGASGAATIITRNDSIWVGLQNASITFEYVNAGATKYLVEIKRS